MAIVVIVIVTALCIVACMLVAQAADKKAAELWVQIVRLTETAPTDPRMHRQVLTLISQMEPEQRKKYTERLYRKALAIVEENSGNIKCRIFALETGRVHHGLHRPDGKITQYDEQAIQNDILVRTRETDNKSDTEKPAQSSETNTAEVIQEETDNEPDTEKPDDQMPPERKEETSWGERKAPNWLVIPFVFCLLGFSVWCAKDEIQKWFHSSPSSPPVQIETQYIKVEPKGADAAPPQMRDFVKQVAKEYGISEEKARQTMRREAEKSYSKDQVEKVFGK